MPAAVPDDRPTLAEAHTRAAAVLGEFRGTVNGRSGAAARVDAAVDGLSRCGPEPPAWVAGEPPRVPGVYAVIAGGPHDFPMVRLIARTAEGGLLYVECDETAGDRPVSHHLPAPLPPTPLRGAADA